MKPTRTLPQGCVIHADGVWAQVMAHCSYDATCATLFLDRDGVVVEEVDYLHRVEEVRLVPGAARVIAEANRRRVPVVLVTNQAGIGRGLYGWDEFIQVQEKILADLAAAGARVDAVFACPHHGGGRAPYDQHNHPSRKPNPGMLLKAAEVLPVDLKRSWIVGDRASDIAAGKNAGLEGGIHVLSGHGKDVQERDRALALAENGFRALPAPTIAEAFALLPMLCRAS